jgi:phosphatidylinositol alpha 1,6-mannosyltransferase
MIPGTSRLNGGGTPLRPSASASVASYVAMGDSFTAGTGCAPGRCWADQLAHRLRRENPRFAYRNLAVEGARSDQVLDQLPDALRLEPELVTVICGANDVLFSVRPDADVYGRRLGAIFGVLRSGLPGVTLATATAPERWDFLGFGPRTRERLERGIVAFNEATREVAAEHGALCLEVAGHPGLASSENFVEDGLHPSAQGHDQAAAGFARLLELEVAA